MQKYYDLEYTIMSCLLQRPELMKEVKLEDKHFVKTKRFWKFMQSFYKKFGNFDVNLMASTTKNNYTIMMYIEQLLDVEPAPSRFNQYQEQLIDLYNEKKKERYIIDRIYQFANDLYVKNITIDEFKQECERTYKLADELYKEE